jgi:Mg/Co/Ni transporter MgtE
MVESDITLVQLGPGQFPKKLKHNLNKKITGTVGIELEVPTLISENQVISTCVDILKKDADKDVGKSLSEIYTYEITKYIKSLNVGEDVVQFSDISVRDRVKIVNNLPLSTNKQIVEFIQDIKEKETDILKVEIDGEVHQIDIDITFFDS